MNTRKLYGIESLEKRFGKMTLALFIKSFRESEDLCQSAFAKKLKISRANLCDIEKGRKMPSISRAFSFAKKLDLPPMILVQLAIQDILKKEKIPLSINLKDAA